jgi:hypothetical protein
MVLNVLLYIRDCEPKAFSLISDLKMEPGSRYVPIHMATAFSQFAIVESVPADALRFKLLKTPEKLDKVAVLKTVGFNKDWVEIVGNP